MCIPHFSYVLDVHGWLKVIRLFIFQLYKQGDKLSDLKLLRRDAHVINVLLREFQIRTMSHIATMSMWTTALFPVQFQDCQLVVEPRNLFGCVIHVGCVTSIARFYHQYLQQNICYKELHTFIENSNNSYIWQKNMSPTELKLIGFSGGLNNRHNHPIAAPIQTLNDILMHGILRLPYGYTK